MWNLKLFVLCFILSGISVFFIPGMDNAARTHKTSPGKLWLTGTLLVSMTVFVIVLLIKGLLIS
jgi:hypothetical protein